MSVRGGPYIIRDGLAFYIDPGNSESIKLGSSVVYNMIDPTINAELTGDISHDGEYFVAGAAANGINFGDHFDFVFDNFTIGTWVNVTSKSGNYSGLIGRSYLANSQGYGLLINNSNDYFHFQVRNYQNMKYAESRHGSFRENEWYYIVGVREYGDYAKIYVNGRIAGVDTNTDDVSCGPSNDTNFYVGGNQGGYDLKNAYQGPTHLYTRNLSSSEILCNYNNMRSRFGL